MKVKNNTRMNLPIIELGRTLRPNEVCDMPFEIAYKYRKYLYPLDATPTTQKPAVPTINVNTYKEDAKNNLTKEVDILSSSKKTVISSLDDLKMLAETEGVKLDPKTNDITTINEELKDSRDEEVKDLLESNGLAVEDTVATEELVDVESEIDSQLGEDAFDTFYGVDRYTSEQIEYVKAHKARSNKRLASELNITEESVAEIRTLVK